MATTKAHQSGLGLELGELLDKAEITYSWGGHAYMAPGVDPSDLASEVVTMLGAAGGLTGIAAVLKTFFGRHKGTKVKFGKDGEVLEVSGLSVDDITRLLDRCSLPTSPDRIWVVRDASGASGTSEPNRDRMFTDELFDMHDEAWAQNQDREPCPDTVPLAARRRSRIGPPQEVVVHDYGEPRVIRRYEDGHEVPRLPGCPPWCDEGGHEGVWARLYPELRHSKTIGIIVLPNEIQVHVGIAWEPERQDLVMITGWAPPGRLGSSLKTRVALAVERWGALTEVATRLAIQGDHVAQLSLSAEQSAQLAELAGLLGLPDLAVHLRNAVATLES